MSISFSAVGTIATVPKLMTSDHRAAFCTFRVACNDRRYDREQGKWIDGDTNWITINAFRGLAVHAEESFSKGDRVIIHGRLRVRKWESAEKSGVAVEVDADALGHDVRWGVSQFTKRSSSPSAEGQEEDSGAEPAERQAGSVAETSSDHTVGTQSTWLAAESTSGNADASEPSSDGFTPGVAA